MNVQLIIESERLYERLKQERAQAIECAFVHQALRLDRVCLAAHKRFIRRADCSW